MDRKKFIQTSGLGLGVALIPGIANSKQLFEKSELAGKLNPKIIKDKEGEVLNVLGDVQTHKLIGGETDNQIVEWVDDVEPGVGIPPHIHTKEDEIFRVIKGQIEIMVAGKTTVLEAGDTAFAPKNIPHSWNVVGTEKAKMITSAFPAGIEEMFKELAKLPPGPPDFEKVAKICGNHGISFLKQ
ncbi:cupin domain-containing protein [Owenweeksia hongkongensis]|uniref:Cupin domain-containing protein n=1 Tax=Owenweeksia hongkongensis (strain DSM 17368 / CIP 108786 / JCM 12287 / NRRL B-23963 / UST20020801) TaxID=926562 RepID=G8R5Z5_OWEHD|nr:cupin domain-containing protein [Owenweeksia hongkongensis]AEV31143.1 cupin domain-containing protein [Owenweeksia hongkongensis DSM 17368]